MQRDNTQMRAGLLKLPKTNHDPREEAEARACVCLVGAALRGQLVREELLEEVRIVALGDVWMAPTSNR